VVETSRAKLMSAARHLLKILTTNYFLKSTELELISDDILADHMKLKKTLEMTALMIADSHSASSLFHTTLIVAHH